DTGVNYDHEDLRNKIWLNRGELPVPEGPCCAPPPGDPHDCNADGVFNVRDYACDARVSDSNGDGALDRGDLRVFVDGIDQDGNGYVDDLSGWDADDDDGDEYDHRYFGHGTGRAGIVGPATDNGKGVAGGCPAGPPMSVRADGTSGGSTHGLVKGVLGAGDGQREGRGGRVPGLSAHERPRRRHLRVLDRWAREGRPLRGRQRRARALAVARRAERVECAPGGLSLRHREKRPHGQRVGQ